MTENAGVNEIDTDLTVEDPTDSDLLKKLRAQLKEAKAQAKAYESEVSSFREARSQARATAVSNAVNGKGYPQAVVDALLAKAQDADDDEFSAILDELGGEAVTEAPPEAPREPLAPSPSTLGQQVAAAATGGGAVDLVAKLNQAKSVEEVQAIALEGGLGKI